MIIIKIVSKFSEYIVKHNCKALLSMVACCKSNDNGRKMNQNIRKDGQKPEETAGDKGI